MGRRQIGFSFVFVNEKKTFKKVVVIVKVQINFVVNRNKNIN